MQQGRHDDDRNHIHGVPETDLGPEEKVAPHTAAPGAFLLPSHFAHFSC